MSQKRQTDLRSFFSPNRSAKRPRVHLSPFPPSSSKKTTTSFDDDSTHKTDPLSHRRALHGGNSCSPPSTSPCASPPCLGDGSRVTDAFTLGKPVALERTTPSTTTPKRFPTTTTTTTTTAAANRTLSSRPPPRKTRSAATHDADDDYVPPLSPSPPPCGGVGIKRSRGGHSSPGGSERTLKSTRSERKDAKVEKGRSIHHAWLDVPARRKDLDGRSPSDAEFDASTLHIPHSALSSMSDTCKQYWSIKRMHMDKLVFFKLGTFYELYEDDADVGCHLLGFKMVERGSRGPFKFCGIPQGAFQAHAAKLLAHGYAVVRVDEFKTVVVDARRGRASSGGKSGKPVVRRRVAQVLTPGTLVDQAYLESSYAQFTLAVWQEHRDGGDHHAWPGSPPPPSSSSSLRYGVAFVDAACGKLSIGQLEGTQPLETLMLSIQPKETLYHPENLGGGEAMGAMLRVVGQSGALKRRTHARAWDATKTLDYLRHCGHFNGGGGGGGKDDGARVGWPNAIEALASDVERNDAALRALGMLLCYLKEVRLDGEILRLGRVSKYDPSATRYSRLHLDANALRHLEVFRNTHDGGSKGTLFALLQRATTALGKRTMVQWVCRPLRDVRALEARLDAVEYLMGDADFALGFETAMMGLIDVERYIPRIFAGKIDLEHFLRVVEALRAMWEYMSSTLPSHLEASAGGGAPSLLWDLALGCPDGIPHALEHLSQAYDLAQAADEVAMYRGSKKSSDKAALASAGLAPRRGKDEQYDDAVAERERLEVLLADHLEQQRAAFRTRQVRYCTAGQGQNKLTHVLEVPNDAVKKMGKERMHSYTLVKRLKNVSRYQSHHVSTLSPSIADAEERIAARKAATLSSALEDVARHSTAWYALLASVATIDCLLGLATVSSSTAAAAMGEPMCRPTFVDAEASNAQPTFHVEGMWHPCLPGVRAPGEEFIPNDLAMSSSTNNDGDDDDDDDGDAPLVILTGPNMGGKSTILRQAAIVVIMAQLGCYVPATRCTLSPCDRIFTRLGAEDNIIGGQSTFMVELSETSHALRDATRHSLVILDELGRGTSTFDGYAIAHAVLKYLAGVGCRTLFSTHYQMLGDEFGHHTGVALKHMACTVRSDRTVCFLYKLMRGVCPKSYGMNVARMAGLPEPVVARAQQVAQSFAARVEAIPRGAPGATRGQDAEDASTSSPPPPTTSPTKDDGATMPSLNKEQRECWEALSPLLRSTTEETAQEQSTAIAGYAQMFAAWQKCKDAMEKS